MRYILVLLPAILCHSGFSQAIRNKHLVLSVSAGAGVLHMASDRDDLADDAVQCGTIRCAFGFAITDRWSLGFHYDRIGTAYHEGVLERLHLTTYVVEGSYRPWTGERATVECVFGLGGTAASLFPNGARLPYTAGGAVLTAGARYLLMVTGTVGLNAGLDLATSSSNELVVNGGVVNADGSASHIQWNSQRLSAGLIVRF